MKIYEKLLEVQKEIGTIKKTEVNPFFNSKYFDVNAILAALKPLLSVQGLVLMQPLSHEGQDLILETRLVDAETGESISEKTILPSAPDAQKYGSAITYFRRYALQSFFALEAEDDDANNASSPSKFPTKATHPDQFQGKKVNTKQNAKADAELDAGYSVTPEL